MEPKRAKEKYPNVYKFIQDTFSGKNFPIANADGEQVKAPPVRFYTNPFSVILRAVLSAMAMGEEEASSAAHDATRSLNTPARSVDA